MVHFCHYNMLPNSYFIVRLVVASSSLNQSLATFSERNASTMHLVNENYLVWISLVWIDCISLLVNNLFAQLRLSLSTLIFRSKNLTVKSRWLFFFFSLACSSFCSWVLRTASLNFEDASSSFIFNESHISFSAECLVWRNHRKRIPRYEKQFIFIKYNFT